MKKILESFKDKKFKYGGYATLMTTVVIVVVVILNLLVNQLPFKLDLTQNQLYSLSEQTTEIVKATTEPISIVGLFKTGQENQTYAEILDNYKSISKNISVRYEDPAKNPQFSKKYAEEGESLPEGTFIVIQNEGQDNEQYKVIAASDMLNYTMNNYGQYQVQSLGVEQQITSAIKYVSATELPTAYTLEGHGEEAIAPEYEKRLKLDNYDINSLSLSALTEIPEDCSLLIINSPTKDLTEKELKMVEDYLNNYGRIMFMVGIVNEEMINFQRIFEQYGVNTKQWIVVEQDKNHFEANYPLLLYPVLAEHATTEPLIEEKLVVPVQNATPIVYSQQQRKDLIVEPLITTTDKAIVKKDINNVKSLEKEEGDEEGQFNLAVAITDNKEWDGKKGKYYSAKIVVLNNTIAMSGMPEQNFDFVLNCTQWLNDEEESIYIMPKDLTVEQLMLTANQFFGYALLTVVIIPLAILITGLVVWRKRRHL